MILRFGDFELDDQLFELRRDGRAIPTQGRAFDVLSYLVARRGVVVGRAELMEQVWQGAVVTKDSVAHAVMAARAALGDDDATPRFIATVRGRGYRFIAPVTEAGDVASSSPSAAHGPASSSRTPFVGRAAAMESLSVRLARAAAGRGCVALISGAAGIGKTRLVEELVAACGDARVLRAPCWSGDGAPELWPFTSLLEDLVEPGHPLPADVAAWDRVLPAEAPESAAARFQVIASIARAIQASVKRTPALLVMDDAHLADRASLSLLELLGSRLAATSLLLVLAHRAPARDARFEPTIAALAQTPGALALHLEPLTRADVALWIEGILGTAHARVVDKVLDKTKGNPLLLSHVAHVLRSGQGLDDREPSTSALIGGDRMRDAVTRHLASLSDGARRVLGAAAALGTTFSIAPLAATAGAGNREILEQLDAAEAAHLIARVSLDAYRFSYPLVRDVLYRSVPAAERARLHARAAAALVDHAGASPDHRTLGEIAMHLVEAAAAGDVEEAIAWSRRAAFAALADGDEEAAARYARRGLDALRLARRHDPGVHDELRAVASRGRR